MWAFARSLLPGADAGRIARYAARHTTYGNQDATQVLRALGEAMRRRRDCKETQADIELINGFDSCDALPERLERKLNEVLEGVDDADRNSQDGGQAAPR